jgi:hypothetical protein
MFSVRYRLERRYRIGSIGATQGKLRSDSIVSLRSEPEMTASPLQTRPSKVGTPPNHDKLTDPVLEMKPERLSRGADGVLLGQKCPLLCRNGPATQRDAALL